MKLIFYKDWNQIGCKAFPSETSYEEAMQWLESNQNIDAIKSMLWTPI